MEVAVVTGVAWPGPYGSRSQEFIPPGTESQEVWGEKRAGVGHL